MLGWADCSKQTSCILLRVCVGGILTVNYVIAVIEIMVAELSGSAFSEYWRREAGSDKAR